MFLALNSFLILFETSVFTQLAPNYKKYDLILFSAALFSVKPIILGQFKWLPPSLPYASLCPDVLIPVDSLV